MIRRLVCWAFGLVEPPSKGGNGQVCTPHVISFDSVLASDATARAELPPPLAIPVGPAPAPENAPIPQNALAAQVCAFAQRRLGQRQLGEWLLERGDQRGLRVLAECPQPWEEDMLKKKQRSTGEVAQEIRDRILGMFPECYHAPSGQFLVATDRANTLRLVPSVAAPEGEGG